MPLDGCAETTQQKIRHFVARFNPQELAYLGELCGRLAAAGPPPRD